MGVTHPGRSAIHTLGDPPWFSDEVLAARQPPVEPEVERWARALCDAYGLKPDEVVGRPALPRWRSFTYQARVTLVAKASIEKAVSDMRSPFWYARQILTLAAIAAWAVCMVSLADHLQPGSFP